ncbi:MAG TPA: protein-L-isoaspartate(D-aspartate) O-methyltransferase [Gemmatimonadales bacterium]|nr:protein-L-isoaspartate(D-aspartate) O-methyltransferase [Gemmatimonadales bacterium]
MLVTQVTSRGVRDPRVLAALARVPREWFLPDALAPRAYEDGPLPIGAHQTISQPYIVALMTECLAPRRTHRVLEIGTGSGYQTAVLARLARHVYTIERIPTLLAEAERRFSRLGLRNVLARLGDGAQGWPEAAPFDRIIVTAAAPRVPEPLMDQLAPEGRLVIPVGDAAAQELLVVERAPAGWRERRVEGVRFVPLISDLAFAEHEWR